MKKSERMLLRRIAYCLDNIPDKPMTDSQGIREVAKKAQLLDVMKPVLRRAIMEVQYANHHHESSEETAEEDVKALEDLMREQLPYLGFPPFRERPE